jgi:TolB-like protein
LGKRSKKMKKFLLTVVFVLVGVMAFAQERIAVFPFENLNNVLTQEESIFFYRQFSNEFANRSAGWFTPVPRVDVEKLFQIEEGFQLDRLSSRAKTAEVERVLNGTQILTGIIGRRGNSIVITISLYSFPDFGQLPGGVDRIVGNTNELFNIIPELVRSMQNEVAGRRNNGRTYNIGDIGPAGGFIFYDKGLYSDGWRYLEAAPVETEFMAGWGQQNVPGTGTAVGSGKQNTQLIVEREQRLGETGSAAQLCARLNYNGFTVVHAEQGRTGFDIQEPSTEILRQFLLQQIFIIIAV